MESIQYYLVENGKQTGPFSFEDLKGKTLTSESLIWFEGLEKWKKADSIEELKELFNQPPPITEIEDEQNVSIPPIPTSDENIDYELAPIGARFGGYLLVNVIVLIIFFVVGGTIEDLENSDGFFRDALWAGLGGALINGIFYPFFSGNLGHKLLGLKVIHKENGEPMNNIFHGLLREFYKGVFSMVIIPVIWLLFDKNRQNLYDKMEKTLVVKNKK
jgi:uncharacterized RDD family membrane protein YckC